MYKINEMMKDLSMMPVVPEKSYKILVVDVNYLISDYKKKDLDTVKSELEKEYGVKVVLIDSSKQNVHGLPSSLVPVYFA